MKIKASTSLLVGALCCFTAATVHATYYYVINAAFVDVYVGLFSVNQAGQVTGVIKPYVYLLKANPGAHRHARFDGKTTSNIRFMFSTNFDELANAIQNKGTTLGTVFTFPEGSYLSQGTATTFRITSEKIPTDVIAAGIPIPLTMKDTEEKPRGAAATASSEKYYSQQQQAKQIEREIDRKAKQEREKEEKEKQISEEKAGIPAKEEPPTVEEIGGVTFHTPQPAEREESDQSVTFHEPQAAASRVAPRRVMATPQKKSFTERAKESWSNVKDKAKSLFD